MREHLFTEEDGVYSSASPFASRPNPRDDDLGATTTTEGKMREIRDEEENSHNKQYRLVTAVGSRQ